MGVRRRAAGRLMKGCFSFILNVNLCFTVCHKAASFLLLRSELSVYFQCVCVCVCIWLPHHYADCIFILVLVCLVLYACYSSVAAGFNHLLNGTVGQKAALTLLRSFGARMCVSSCSSRPLSCGPALLLMTQQSTLMARNTNSPLFCESPLIGLPVKHKKHWTKNGGKKGKSMPTRCKHKLQCAQWRKGKKAPIS